MKNIRSMEQTLMRVCMLAVLVLAAVCLLSGAVLGILSLTAPEQPDSESIDPTGMQTPYPTYDPNATADVGIGARPRVLTETEDAGESYVDRMIFVGESTTAHLRSRGVLREGKNTVQVWSNASNTMTLDLKILQKTIVYPISGVEMTIPDAVAIAKPELLVLSFGMNGIYGFAKNTDLYRAAYGRLIEAVHTASPQTVVVLQTVYPVAANQTTFPNGATLINEYAARLNAMLPDIAQEYDAYVVDTASCLTNAAGLLRDDYQSGDGLHLTKEAYLAVLNYLRTHAYVP